MLKEIGFFQIASALFCVSIYAVYVAAAYVPSIKDSWRFVAIGLTYALIGHTLWIFSVKPIKDTKTIFVYAVCWDALLSISAILIPVLFLSVRLSAAGFAGIALVVMGLFVLKFA